MYEVDKWDLIFTTNLRGGNPRALRQIKNFNIFQKWG